MNRQETPEDVKTHDYAKLEEFDGDGFPDSLDEVIAREQEERSLLRSLITKYGVPNA